MKSSFQGSCCRQISVLDAPGYTMLLDVDSTSTIWCVWLYSRDSVKGGGANIWGGGGSVNIKMLEKHTSNMQQISQLSSEESREKKRVGSRIERRTGQLFTKYHVGYHSPPLPKINIFLFTIQNQEIIGLFSGVH